MLEVSLWKLHWEAGQPLKTRLKGTKELSSATYEAADKNI